MINYCNAKFRMFSSEVGDEEEGDGMVDAGLYLWDDLKEREDGCALCVVVAVRDDVNDDIDECVTRIEIL